MRSLLSAGLVLVLSHTALAQGVTVVPPPPSLPETEARDAQGHVTVRAVRLSVPLRVDGRFDESVYQDVRPITGMVQSEPNAGQPFTERTEMWVSFDATNVYMSIRCWDSHPERAVLNEMRRDHSGVASNDHISFTLDTFYDRRNAVSFTLSGIGGRMDGQFTDERLYNGDWNPVWNFAVEKFDGGWAVEMAVPFKSLRYAGGRNQLWGVNVRRFSRWKNEMGHLTPIPRALSARGMFMVSLEAALVGIEAPPPGRNLEIKPYVTGSVTSDTLARPVLANDPSGDVGVDLKYGLGQGLTADFTYNTDFAQVEADEQQVNLTRFNLFFPEKREFFLENSGMFSFGGIGTGFGGAGGDVPTMFYSRRIGLFAGRAVPILAGGRLSGRAGRFNVGALSIQTANDAFSGSPSTNYSLLRIKRDVLRKSGIGILATHRSRGERRAGSNDVLGADALFGFYDNLIINTYWARSITHGVHGDDVSYRAQVDYAGDRYGVQVEQLAVGANFDPGIGFVRRQDSRRSFVSARFSPRPARARVVRKFFYTGSLTYIENATGRLEARDIDAGFGIEFQRGDRLNVGAVDRYEYLPGPFRIAPTVLVPVGGYEYASWRASYSFGDQRRRGSGTLSIDKGTLYGGTRTSYGFGGGRMELTPRFSLQPSVSVNSVSLPQGAFRATLVGSRVTYTMTPFMFVSALVQYNSTASLMAINARLRWEYAPGSELFIVYNDQRDTTKPGLPGLQNRAFIVKVNRLLRF